LREGIISICPGLEAVFQREPELEGILDTLIDRGLGAVFEKYLVNASESALANMLREAARLDFARIARHRQALRRGERSPLKPDQVAVVPLVTLEEQAPHRSADRALGLESLRQGNWASVAFAGGAGTRFFSQLDKLNEALPWPNQVLRAGRFDPQDPKGVFPISPVGGLSFYEIILAQALHAGIQAGRLPWVLFLTSQLTHEPTIRYLSRQDLWGFPASGWIAFMQAQEPRLDADGDLIVVDEQGHLSSTGDGHGGVFRALLAKRRDGKSLVEFLGEYGVSDLVMHNVDNAAARPFDPSRLGFHRRENALFTLSAVRKTDPEEKVGVLMLLTGTGRVEVVEYNVLDPAVARARDAATGRLQHEAGNTNTNLVSIEAIRADFEPTLYTGKKVNSRVGLVESSSLELLNQHITRLLDPGRVRAFEVSREKFFIPTKNVTGADSVESSSRMLSDLSAHLLSRAGAKVAQDALVDLHPACGLDPNAPGLPGWGAGWSIGPGARLYLCVHCPPGDSRPVNEGSVDLEPDSSLIVSAARPYGDVSVDSDRRVKVDGKSASRVHIGKNVAVRKGVRVVVRVGRGARLEIPAGRIFTRDIECEVREGEELEL
jgi:hypothetical protein